MCINFGGWLNITVSSSGTGVNRAVLCCGYHRSVGRHSYTDGTDSVM